jgi:hypothetical protein
VASAWFGEGHPPVDALIIGSVDPQSPPTTGTTSTTTSTDPARPGSAG